MISSLLSASSVCAIRHDAFDRLRGEVAQRRDLGEREPRRAQRRFGRREHCLRRREIRRCADGVDEPREDRVRRRAVQLLMRDRARERLERRRIPDPASSCSGRRPPRMTPASTGSTFDRC